MAIGSTSAVERRRSSATRVKLRGPLAEAATLPRPSRSILGGQPATPRTTSSLSSSGATSEGAPSIARPGHTPRRPAQPTRARTAIIGASSASSTSSWVRATVTLRILQQQQPKGRHEGHAERIDAEIGADEKARDERHAAWPAPPRSMPMAIASSALPGAVGAAASALVDSAAVCVAAHSGSRAGGPRSCSRAAERRAA